MVGPPLRLPPQPALPRSLSNWLALAAVQVLLFMGAIVMLIIFTIMLPRRMMGIREETNNPWPIGLAMSALAFLVIGFVLSLANSTMLPSGPANPVSIDTIVTLGKALVDPGQYALPFELASLLLTAAMIGA